MAEYNAWAGPYGLHLPADPDVLYLSRIDDALWWELLPDGTLYVQNNRTDRLPSTAFDDLTKALHEADVSRVALDLRHNYGGELSAVDVIEAPFRDPAVDRPGQLFVFTGRNTFSGGSLLVARLQRDTDAQIVGEPMGGCPTIWSDPSDLILPWSGITVSVAGDVAVGVDPHDARLTIKPDIPAPLTFDDWTIGTDPALSAISAGAP
jgi:C-terminal processing protease CtpA/Prc